MDLLRRHARRFVMCKALVILNFVTFTPAPFKLLRSSFVVFVLFSVFLRRLLFALADSVFFLPFPGLFTTVFSFDLSKTVSNNYNLIEIFSQYSSGNMQILSYDLIFIIHTRDNISFSFVVGISFGQVDYFKFLQLFFCVHIRLTASTCKAYSAANKVKGLTP